jgi:hypothetical protein
VGASGWSAKSNGAGVPLTAVYGLGPNDIWAVGGPAMHFDGASWTVVPTKQQSGRDSLRGVWGAAANDVWAVGDDGLVNLPSNILHWDGHSWSQNLSTDAMFVLNGIWGSAANDAWIVGDRGNILHYDGVNWSLTGVVKSGTTAGLNAVWGASAQEVWVVGQMGTILHYDGATWAASPSGTNQVLNAVWGTGPSDVWAVGGYPSGVALHWDGASWKNVPISTSTPTGMLTGLSGTAGDDVWMVSQNGGILHWDGTLLYGLSADGGRNPSVMSGTTKDLLAVWANKSFGVLAVGAGGAILRRH